MSPELRQRIIQICEQKVASKGAEVGLSFYAFFQNRNDNPQELMSAAVWWIQTHELNHFEKASKILDIVLSELESARD